jgi:hypothetical protein
VSNYGVEPKNTKIANRSASDEPGRCPACSCLKISVFPKSRTGENARKIPLLRNRAQKGACMRTGLTNNRNVLTATTHRSTATPVYLQYPKYVAGVEHALHMAYKHLICKCKNSFAFTDFQFANLVAIFTNVCYNVTMYFDKGDFPICASAITSSGRCLLTKI